MYLYYVYACVLYLRGVYFEESFITNLEEHLLMKAAITYACLLGSLVIFCLAVNIFETLVMFLLFGVVPGQTTPLAAQDMLAFYFSICGIILVVSLQKRLGVLHQRSSQLPSTNIS